MNRYNSFFNGRLIAYAIISTFLIILLFDYVKPDAKELVSYLSYGIYLVGCTGIYIFYQYYFRTEKEWSCARLTHNQAANILFEVKVNGLEYHLHEFKELGTKDEDLSVNRILSHIYTEAENKKFDSSLAILNASKDDFSVDIMRLFSFQKVALQLGILGTFIGLAMAFKDLSGQDINGQAIDHLLKSLRIPFSTSIAGLQISFILWMHIDYLQGKQKRMFRILETCVDEVINLARHAIYRDSITVELQHVSLKMDELAGKIEKGNDLIYSQNTKISDGLERLRSANTDFDGFLIGIAGKQQSFLSSVKALYESLSPEAISTELKSGLSKGAEEISGIMSRHLNNTLNRYSEVEASIAKMNDHFKKMQENLETQTIRGTENINATKNEIFQVFTQVIGMQKQYMEYLTKTDMRKEIRELMASSTQHITKELKSDFEKLTPAVSSLVKEISLFNKREEDKLQKKQNRYNSLTFWKKRKQ